MQGIKYRCFFNKIRVKFKESAVEVPYQWIEATQKPGKANWTMDIAFCTF